LKPLLTKVSFNKDCRTFKSGEEIVFKVGLTALVGLNGCGKSTILECLRTHFKIKDDSYLKGNDVDGSATVETSSEKFEVKYFDFHSGDKKFAGSFGDDIMGQLQAGRASSGIGNLLQFGRTGIKNMDDGLIILDEPDRGLAPKIQRDMASLLKKLYLFANNQIVVSTHSTYIMDVANQIYSVEHKRYFDSTKDFLEAHLK
jgi:predicted ATPase